MEYRLIAPGYRQCASEVVEEQLVEEPNLNLPPGDPNRHTTRQVRFVTKRICAHRFQTGPVDPAAPTCRCGFFAIGVCQQCQNTVCGKHSDSMDELLCTWCVSDQRAMHEERAEEAKCERKINLLLSYSSRDDFDLDVLLFKTVETFEHRLNWGPHDHERVARLLDSVLSRDPRSPNPWIARLAAVKANSRSAEATLQFNKRTAEDLKRQLQELKDDSSRPAPPSPPSGISRWSSAAKHAYNRDVSEQQAKIRDRPYRIRSLEVMAATADDQVRETMRYVESYRSALANLQAVAKLMQP